MIDQKNSSVSGEAQQAGGLIELRLRSLGISLPTPSVPPAIYSPTHSYKGVVSVSGQPPYVGGVVAFRGKVGRDLSLEEGVQSARASALNVLAHLKLACGGDLDRVRACVELIVFVSADPEFFEVHRVADGASSLIRDVFEPMPPPTRSSLGCAVLPMNITTEVQARFLINVD